jgi:putative alpha-1,2-mannosidase
MKSIFSTCFLLLQAWAFGQNVSPVDYVNPLMGTQSKPSLSNGNTYPAVGLPWGMNIWTHRPERWVTDGRILTMQIK